MNRDDHSLFGTNCFGVSYRCCTLRHVQVELLEKTLSSERTRLAEERQVNSRSTSELAALRSDLQTARDTIHRNTNTDHYYQTKVSGVHHK